jgi:hypothetical protein
VKKRGAAARFLPFAFVCALALGRAVVASPPASAPSADEGLRRTAFRAVASKESEMRVAAAKEFPTDVWSRDDDFHERERERASDWATLHHARMGDVLSALDEGLRAGWPQDNPDPLTPTTPPCRPRASY